MTSEPWTPSSTTSGSSSSNSGEGSASSSGSISPIAAKQGQTAAAMAASTHARLATEFGGRGGKFKSVKDAARAHSAPAAQHRGAGNKPMSAEDEAWLYVMPRQRVRPKECDEVPDEFRRAGIGLCFEGNKFSGPTGYDVDRTDTQQSDPSGCP